MKLCVLPNDCDDKRLEGWLKTSFILSFEIEALNCFSDNEQIT